MSVPVTAEQHQQAIEKEYGEWVAIQAIDVNGARAFNPGDPVPTSHVTGGVVRNDQVARATTKAAAAVISTEKG